MRLIYKIPNYEQGFQQPLIHVFGIAPFSCTFAGYSTELQAGIVAWW
jgi:hypothetical protein